MDPEIIGYIAGTLTTLCFLPQVYKAVKAPNTHSISLIMYSLFSVGVFFWLIYGLMLNSMPVIICNAVTLPLSLIILVKKIYNIKKGLD